jgi:hypothetical protein
MMIVFAGFFQNIADLAVSLWAKDPLASVALLLLILSFVALAISVIGPRVEAMIYGISPALVIPKVDSRIGYKRAWLEGDSFKGVVGVPYDVDEEAKGPGFHAYSSFRDARYHPQAGNVYLEVLLSGEIRE